MNIERWLYQILDVKAKMQELFPTNRVEATIKEPTDYGLPMIHVIVYSNEDVDTTMDKLDKVINWWIERPNKFGPDILITSSFE